MMQVLSRSPARAAGQVMLPVAAAGAFLLAVRLGLPAPEAPARAALLALAYAAAAPFALLLFCPRPRGMRAVIGWSASVALLVAAMTLADPAARPVASALPALGVTLFLLCATLMILRRALPAPLLFTVLVLLTFLPLTGAPLIEVTGNPLGLTGAVVAASPLSAFAVALELDYLRTTWFYAHSALGSLRYAYPGWAATCGLLALIPAAALLARGVRRDRFQPPDEAHKHENETSPLADPVASPLPDGLAGGGTGSRSQRERQTRRRRGSALPAHQPGG